MENSGGQGGLAAESMAVEWALVGHPAVAEVVAVQMPTLHTNEPLRVFVVPQTGYAPDAALAHTLAEYVLQTVGPNGPALDVRFVESLPKTRTGKVARWLLQPPNSTG